MSVILKACATAPVLCAPVEPGGRVSDYSLNVSRHVLLHQTREFDLPILGNGETMADAYATVVILQEMREDAAAILGDRARPMQRSPMRWL
jgi:hypothetical protein